MKKRKLIELNHQLSRELFDKGFRTPDTYVSAFFEPLPKSSGIYVFLKTDIDKFSESFGAQSILYVGQSINIFNRINRHEIARQIEDFFQVWFLSVNKNVLTETEKKYIYKYDPPWNIIHRRRGV